MNRHSTNNPSHCSLPSSPHHAAPVIDPPALDLLLHQREPITIEAIALRQDITSKIVLRELEELKYREIAEVLSLSLNEVKVLIHRGRKSLLRILKRSPLFEGTES